MLLVVWASSITAPLGCAHDDQGVAHGDTAGGASTRAAPTGGAAELTSGELRSGKLARVAQLQRAQTEMPCEVRLERLVYDSSGSDQAELIELQLELVASSFGDAGIPTLGACDLVLLELVNGSNADCETYRRIPLVSAPAKEELRICSPSSLLAPCDIEQDETGALPNGWIQNGPSDGFRLLTSSGDVALAYQYAGSAECFVETTLLPAQSDTQSIRWCDPEFLALPIDQSCPDVASSPETEAGNGAGSPSAGQADELAGTKPESVQQEGQGGSGGESNRDSSTASEPDAPTSEVWGEARVASQTTTPAGTNRGATSDAGVSGLFTSLDIEPPEALSASTDDKRYGPADLPSRDACSISLRKREDGLGAFAGALLLLAAALHRRAA